MLIKKFGGFMGFLNNRKLFQIVSFSLFISIFLLANLSLYKSLFASKIIFKQDRYLSGLSKVILSANLNNLIKKRCSANKLFEYSKLLVPAICSIDINYNSKREALVNINAQRPRFLINYQSNMFNKANIANRSDNYNCDKVYPDTSNQNFIITDKAQCINKDFFTKESLNNLPVITFNGYISINNPNNICANSDNLLSDSKINTKANRFFEKLITINPEIFNRYHVVWNSDLEVHFISVANRFEPSRFEPNNLDNLKKLNYKDLDNNLNNNFSSNKEKIDIIVEAEQLDDNLDQKISYIEQIFEKNRKENLKKWKRGLLADIRIRDRIIIKPI